MPLHSTTPRINFEQASAEQLLASLTPRNFDGPESNIWTGRLMGMLEAVIPALVELRDIDYFVLDEEKVGEYLDLPHVVGLAQNPLLRYETRARLNAYLMALPGFSQDGITPSNEIHHGFLTMQVASILK